MEEELPTPPRRSLAHLAVVVVLSLLAGGGITFGVVTILGGSEPVSAAQSENSCYAPDSYSGEASEIPVVTANLAEPGRYAKLRMTAELTEGADLEKFHHQWPVITDTAISYFGAKTPADLGSVDLVKRELTCLIKERLAGKASDQPLDELFMVEFVVQ